MSPFTNGIRADNFEALVGGLSLRVEQALGRTGYLPLRKLRVDVHEGQVTLRGRLSTYYLKQVAQNVVQQVHGAERVQNEIVVALGSDEPPMVGSSNFVSAECGISRFAQGADRHEN